MIKITHKRHYLSAPLILFVVFLLIFGGTYAWFSQHKEIQQKISMGSLKVTADFATATITSLQPGETNGGAVGISSSHGSTPEPINGTFENSGSIRAFCRIDKEILLKLKYTSDQDWQEGIAILEED